MFSSFKSSLLIQDQVNSVGDPNVPVQVAGYSRVRVKHSRSAGSGAELHKATSLKETEANFPNNLRPLNHLTGQSASF